MMLDLDNLKALNDAYGHDTGDRYIRETGRTLHDAMTGNSVCSRLSGDEFMVLFYGYDSREQLRRDLNSLQSRLRRASIVLPNGDSFAVSISGGVKFLHRISHIDSQNGYSRTDNIFAVLIISSMSLYFHSRGTSFGIGVYVYLNHFN